MSFREILNINSLDIEHCMKYIEDFSYDYTKRSKRSQFLRVMSVVFFCLFLLFPIKHRVFLPNLNNRKPL